MAKRLLQDILPFKAPVGTKAFLTGGTAAPLDRGPDRDHPRVGPALRKSRSPEPAPAAAKAKAPRARRAPAARPAPAPGLQPVIDYPREGEPVRPGHYAVRIGASGATEAQASVDGGEWTACRAAEGYFWLDWYPEAGIHVLAARARVGKGRWVKSGKRPVAVAA